MKKPAKTIDWPSIEADYRSGGMSVREMARWHGVDEKAIRKKARADGWVREREPGHLVREALAVSSPALGDPKDLTDRARGLAGRMMDELDAVTSLHGELTDMICDAESDPRRRQALLKVLSLGERAMTLKNLSTTLKTLNEVAAPEGKKAQRQERAEAASSAGKFAVRGAPKLVVSNK